MVHFLAFSLYSKLHNENRQIVPSSFAMPLLLDHGSDARGGNYMSGCFTFGESASGKFFCLYVCHRYTREPESNKCLLVGVEVGFWVYDARGLMRITHTGAVQILIFQPKLRAPIVRRS